MKKFLVFLLLIAAQISTAPTASAMMRKKPSECAAALLKARQIPDAFIFYLASKLQSYGSLPKQGTAVSRLIQIESGDAESEEETPSTPATAATAAAGPYTFEHVLMEYGLTPEDWKSIESLEFKKGAILGTREFHQLIESGKIGRVELDEKQLSALRKLNRSADEAREKLKAYLFMVEAAEVSARSHFLGEAELTKQIQQYTQDPKSSLKTLGYSSVADWRDTVLVERDKLKGKIEKGLMEALKNHALATGEIPETETELYAALAGILNSTPQEVQHFFGKGKVFEGVNQFIDQVQEKFPYDFATVIDRRFFTQARTDRMLKAARESHEIILFKLAENQGLNQDMFASIENLAKDRKAPIIVAPAFSVVGLIPKTLSWLFDHPNVHVLVDQGLQLTKNFYVVNNGTPDKQETPLVGLDTVFADTDQVVLFHPKIRTQTRPTGNYDTTSGFMMTTGSPSDPAYWSKFNVGISTDFRSQREAEMNQGVLILSRGYANEMFSDLIEGANGIVPRRVQYTAAKFGNPAGFYDMGKIYSPDAVKSVDFIPAMVLPDLHYPITDPEFLKGLFDLMLDRKILKKNARFGQAGEYEYTQGPVRVGVSVIHDLADGTPNNRHTLEMLVTRAKQDTQGALDIYNHFQSIAAFVTQYTKMLDTKLVVPIDNHGYDWLMRVIQEGDLAVGHRPRELPLILKLMQDAIQNGGNVYERIFQHFGVDTDKVEFIASDQLYRAGIDISKPNESSITQGVEVGQHTHQGVNGAKSISIKKLLGAYGASVGGHVHTTQEYGQARRVGTGTPRRQDYHKGPSSSDVSIAFAYSENATQILREENGTFVPNDLDQDPDSFFPNAEFPKLMVRKRPPGGNTTEQYRVNPPVNRIPMR